MTITLPYSKGRIDRAGRVLRRVLVEADPRPSPAELAEATAVAEAFRSAHRGPMTNARMGLRSCIETEGLVVVEFTQRLKRMPTVVDKLRQPRSRGRTTRAARVQPKSTRGCGCSPSRTPTMRLGLQRAGSSSLGWLTPAQLRCLQSSVG